VLAAKNTRLSKPVVAVVIGRGCQDSDVRQSSLGLRYSKAVTAKDDWVSLRVNSGVITSGRMCIRGP
jgi:hypothetical protein